MEDWDEQKLRSVVARRGGDPPNKTDIVSDTSISVEIGDLQIYHRFANILSKQLRTNNMAGFGNAQMVAASANIGTLCHQTLCSNQRSWNNKKRKRKSLTLVSFWRKR